MIHCISFFFCQDLGTIFPKLLRRSIRSVGEAVQAHLTILPNVALGEVEAGKHSFSFFQIWRIFKKTIRFLHVNVMWWLLLRAVFTKPCVYWVCLSLLVFVFRYSFATSLQTSVMCMAIMLSLTFGDCRSLLMSHEAVHTSMFSWEQEKPSHVMH